MNYYSTRNSIEKVCSKKAIINGLASNGGLYTPFLQDIKKSSELVKNTIFDATKTYEDIAHQIFSVFFTDYTKEELENCIHNAYETSLFTNNGVVEKDITPVSKIGDAFLLELYHGPTSAFKDIALTILPHFITTAYKSEGISKKIYILTATSGDTGKAALSGFKDVDNTFITVFYPTVGVSNIQKLQMQTSKGSNVSVIAIDGNFDDCQTLVKSLYSNQEILNAISNKAILSSANSINIGRLIPQIVYYFKAYNQLVKNNEIPNGDAINFTVPTGNFGDILAGYFAKLLGLPINKLICASNENNVLTDFINTGLYNKNRSLHKTISPSMDILVSSNLERLLFLLSDDLYVNSLMSKLKEKGAYQVDKNILINIQDSFCAYYTTDEQCKSTIKKVFETYNKIIDPHTAVAYDCYLQYQKETNDKTKNIILSTASAYKFTKDVLLSLGITPSINDFDAFKQLEEISNEAIPENLKELKNLDKRFKDVFSKEEAIIQILGTIHSL